MRRMHIAVLLVLLATAIVGAGCSEAGLGGDSAEPLEQGGRTRAPAVSLPALDGGKQITLASHLGRPVVLNFWASWCEPCTREMPTLIEFAKDTPGLDVVGLAVSDRPADSRRFAEEVGITFDLGIDREGEVAREFGVTGLPVTVIVDPEGRIADTFFGEISRAQLDSYAEQLGL
jgi:cytochrome c biogenesis protein CcmG, thiol:disulfide interchange protein DsbE